MAPEGCVLNAQWPSAVVGGWETHARLVEVLFNALLPALPERMPAGTKGMMCQAGFGSLDVEAGSYTCFYDTFAGGYGGRLESDGPDAVQTHGQNTENAPIEETELNYPVRIGQLSLVENSEGAGRHRGGLGLRKDYRVRPPDDLHDPRRPRPRRPLGRPRRPFGPRSPNTCTFATASRRGSARRRPSSSSPATRSRSAPAAAAATATPWSATRCSSCATCSRER